MKESPHSKKSIESFLVENDFELMEPGSYANNFCNVVITDEDGLEIAYNYGDVTYCKTYDLFWLAGVLTWHGLIPCNYKKVITK